MLWMASGTALAKPALWKVSQGSSTLYLFGTVHLMSDSAKWEYPALKKAMAASQALYIEITDDNPANMQALVMKYGVDMQHPLSDKLDPADRKRLAAAAKSAGMPGGMAALNIMQPWLAAVTLTVVPLVKAGLDPKAGADKVIKRQMSAAGKPVHGLETAEQQIRMLADMAPKTQIAFLKSALDDIDDGAAKLRKLTDAWQRGDVNAIARFADADMRKASPVVYQHLLVDRNKRWAPQLKALLAKPGTRFVAVGAAHLAGPDSVQHQLAALGLHAERVQ
ncbi:TraB/GumN family protein [Oleiagrimonas sp. C23AA]|nr:TraB/GumN family protein [Oleiagrimonas sp. C23AA]